MQTIEGTPRATSAYIASRARCSAAVSPAAIVNQTGPGRNPKDSTARFSSGV